MGRKFDKSIYDCYLNSTLGRLTIIDIYVEVRNGKNITMVKCVCSCGRDYHGQFRFVKAGTVVSCGCYQKERARDTIQKHVVTHGKTETKTYSIWCAMKARCYQEGNKSYINYGGRGIKVCDRWKNSFNNFLEDMGECPSNRHSIDRINNEGDYSATNCKWSLSSEQARNRRSSKKESLDGVIKNRVDWSKEFNIPKSTLSNKLNSGMTLEEIREELSI